MRISDEMADSIVELSRMHIAPDAVVWLFGSRAKDSARGGDIDLMIEATGIDNPLERKINFRLAFEDRWGEQKVDIIVHDRLNDDLAIHEIVRGEGVRLC
ncbi:nucleotidyltransferase domain-containing protein [Endozoicomonas gorgoniicola]|uniref:Nucleotidyltransferase domain-containing protein n=1 Tax=Endozoicomonas gorgoniicola TaxID=1234144 RepID=A0ABT3MUV3_9GAMM|nr:nucleotidyltransferase domain-containing protein [Endozoicomonas gorgoniicola]MCW7553156.1 nucleotidyltransferase domain-containing protein [Endozoicomonas gorgoniicola]